MPPLIPTGQMVTTMRDRVLDVGRARLLISDLDRSRHENDLTLPPNAGGLGRRRHFRRRTVDGWPDNPLPIVPASRWLGIESPEAMQAQVFQLAACAWRCWYCYVPFELLSADMARSRWVDASTLLRLYLEEQDRPFILDLSGGSPDLAPEWIGWTMDAIEREGAQRELYLWSDDNLSTDLLLRERGDLLERLEHYGCGYGRACCIKGFDPASFSFNTKASADGFDEQLRILDGYARTSLDLYLYITLTAVPRVGDEGLVTDFVQRLAAIREDLPRRTVPLVITRFTSMLDRIDGEHATALEHQWRLLEAWQDGMTRVGLGSCE